MVALKAANDIQITGPLHALHKTVSKLQARYELETISFEPGIFHFMD